MSSLRSRVGGLAATAAVSGIAIFGFGASAANARSGCAGNTTVAKTCTVTGASNTFRGEITKKVQIYFYKLHVTKGERLTFSVLDKESTACLTKSYGKRNTCGMLVVAAAYGSKLLGKTLVSQPSGNSAGKLASTTAVAPGTGTVHFDLTGIQSTRNTSATTYKWVQIPFVLTVRTS